MTAIPKGVPLSTKAGEKVNAMTIGWGTMGTNWSRPVFAAYIRKGPAVKRPFMGTPPAMMVFNLCLTGIFVLSFHFFWVIPLNIAIHGAVIYVTKQDADVFYCLRSYMQQKRNYNA